MNRYIVKYLTCTLFIISSLSTFAQNAWTKKKGEVYLQASANFINSYDKLFSSKNDVSDYNLPRKVADNVAQIYGEVGLTDRTTLLASVPLKFVSTGDATVANPIIEKGSLTGLGNLTLGIRHLFYSKNINIAGQLNIDTKTSSFNSKTGLSTGYDAWSFTPTISLGKGWNRYYFQGFTGVTIRTNNFNHSFKIGGEGGYKLAKPLWIIGFVDVNLALNEGKVVLPLSNYLTGLYVNKQEYVAYGIKSIIEVNKGFGINLAIGGAVAGNYVAETPSFNIGFYLKFK